MNTRLLRKVETRILKTPKRFNMRYFAVFVSKMDELRDMLAMPVCKTQACIAGETLLAAGLDIADRAQKALGLTTPEACRLFYFREWSPTSAGWPHVFQTAYQAATTPAARAKVAAERIEHFILTNGAE